MEYTFSKEDIELVEKFINIKNKGFYADGGQVTALYNRVLHKNVNVTNCGTCIRGRIQEMENALNAFKRLSENVSAVDPTTTKEEENKATGGHSNEATADENKSTEKKRVGRPPKKN